MVENPKLLLVDHRLEPTDCGLPATIVTDLKDDPRLFSGSNRTLALGNGQSERLLHKDMLAGGGRLLYKGGVRRMWCRYQQTLNLWI